MCREKVEYSTIEYEGLLVYEYPTADDSCPLPNNATGHSIPHT